MHGELEYPVAATEAVATSYVNALAQRLREAQPTRLDVRGHTLELRAGMFRFVWNWNLLLGVSSATIHVLPMREKLLVRYDVRTTEMKTVSGLFGIAGVGIGLGQQSIGLALTSIFAAGFWFGAYYLVTQFRMRALMRELFPRAVRT